MTFTNRHYTPTAITATFPPVVTVEGHDLQEGQRIRATMFVTLPEAVATGMQELNNRLFVVQQATDDTFELWGLDGLPVDGSNYTAFVSNGLAQFTLTGPDIVYSNNA